MRRLIGLGYRHAYSPSLLQNRDLVSCLEITAEHFFDNGKEKLTLLQKQVPLFVHGLGLSLGTKGPLEPNTLSQFNEVVKAANPLWISEHISFTRTKDVDLGHLNPILPSKETIRILTSNVKELSSKCNKPVILENITSHLKLNGEMKETVFLNQVCEEADCGLLLDVTNLFINSKNHGFNPYEWFKEIDPQRIVQLHIVGYSVVQGRWQDHHKEFIQPDLLELAAAIISYAPVKAIILERDEDLHKTEEIIGDLEKLKSLKDA
jgi:uncharacterized protein (UPF0276 family)